MNCWELLGIPATGDVRDIKKAYARLLRKFPPETDPEGFKGLRTAYEEALFLAQLGLTGTGPAEPSAASAGETQAAAVSGTAEEASYTGGPRDPGAAGTAEIVLGLPDPPPPPAEVEAAMARIRKDFPVHALRESEAYWKGLAESDLLWDLSAKTELGILLFRFLGETYLELGGRYTAIHVPRESWKVLDQAFGWLENEGEWYARFPEDLANAVLDRIRAARDLALSTDLKGPYRPSRDLLVEGPDISGYGWLGPAFGAIVGILGVLALNGVFFRCS